MHKQRERENGERGRESSRDVQILIILLIDPLCYFSTCELSESFSYTNLHETEKIYVLIGRKF